MFDAGFTELLFIFALGLLVLGPERLPRVASQIGNWAGQARRMARALSSQMRQELDLENTIQPPTQQPRQDYSAKRPGVGDLATATPEEATPADDADDTPEIGPGGYTPDPEDTPAGAEAKSKE